MSSDWRYAKDITRQRLAAAKARASSDAMMVETAAQMVGNATLMLENATRNFKSAKDNLDKSRDEVRAAEALMREAEERWMEIVIDDETSTAPPSNERRRVSASPPTIEGVSNAVTVGESTHGNGNIVAAAGSTSGQSSVGESNAPTMISSSSGGYVAAATAGQSSHGTGNISVRAVVSNAAGNRNVITAVGLTAGGSSVGESNVPAMIVSPPGGLVAAGTTGKSSHGTGTISGTIGTAAFTQTRGIVPASSSGGATAAATAGQSSHGAGNVSGAVVVSNAVANIDRLMNAPAVATAVSMSLTPRAQPQLAMALPQALRQATSTNADPSNGNHNDINNVVVNGGKHRYLNGAYQKRHANVYMKKGKWNKEDVTYEMIWSNSCWNFYRYYRGTRSWMTSNSSERSLRIIPTP
ncbi:hypothetical protein ACHAXA_007110 [Cyclostephanos tholiformis]|uniref:Uncharacterized protein n=1 Tax=Cyclostephanos tholiformis TaxID=382380 RepID=A0ABD3RYJ9_9STRA